MKTCPVCDTPYPDHHRTCSTDGAVLIESLELEPGHILRNKYRILSKLGQGGMGVVYLAEHIMLGGKVALKFLASELSRNPQFVKRFRNEARAAYQLRHPNIVEVTDLDQAEDGSLFIAMEYVAGPSLRSVLRETTGPIPVPRALQIARGLTAGLAAAHARGAIHRDIKPENILLRVEPAGEVQPKILDFGIAAMTENITDLSRTHGLLLTPEYAAPEQWRGTPANELDGRTDLYALGGVLYEMLAGRTPFHAVNPEGWMFQHLQGVPEPLGVLRPDLALDYPQLDAVVMRLLARDRDQRFDSAAALLQALALNEFDKPASTRLQTVIEGLHPRETLLESRERLSVEAAPKTELTPSPDAGGNLFSTISPPAPVPKWRFPILIGSGVVLVIAIVFFIAWSLSRSQVESHSVPGALATSSANNQPQPDRTAPPPSPTHPADGSIVRNAPRPNDDPVTIEKRTSKANPQLQKAPGSTLSEPTGKNQNVSQSTQDSGSASLESAEKKQKVVIEAGVAQGMLLQKTVPVYPPIAKAARISGTVVLQATISKTGSIENLHVVSGPGMLQQAALDAVQTWRYRPYLLGNEPVEVETTINVIFTLGN